MTHNWRRPPPPPPYQAGNGPELGQSHLGRGQLAAVIHSINYTLGQLIQSINIQGITVSLSRPHSVHLLKQDLCER